MVVVELDGDGGGQSHNGHRTQLIYIYNLGVIHHSQDYSFMLMQTARSLDDSVGITLPSVKFYSG